MTVDILCRVVDNLGDIGFVYRLARALSELPGAPRLRLVVDDLAAFSGLCPAVSPDVPLQTVEGWLVVRRDDPGEAALALFRTEPPRAVIECYACGRPDWFDAILFDETDQAVRHIVNVEYLTAESWARDFHLLPSFTRSPLVRKSVFMPGFVPGTGGLVRDAAFNTAVETCATSAGRLDLRHDLLRCPEIVTSSSDPLIGGAPASGLSTGDQPADAFWVLVFSYEHDFLSLVADLASFHAETPLLALVASGRSAAPFIDAWTAAGRLFPVLELPLLPQTRWDQFLAASDFLIVRGEESLSRACLSGRPFLWQCYPFADVPPAAAPANPTAIPANPTAAPPDPAAAPTGQLPKVHALLSLIRPYLAPADFACHERLTLRFNGGAEPERGDLLAVLRAVEAGSDGSLASGFGSWARDVRKIGNLAANLLTFMRDFG